MPDCARCRAVGCAETSSIRVSKRSSTLIPWLYPSSSRSPVWQQVKNSLAILPGKPPQDLNYLLGEQGAIPDTPATIALGMSQNLIRQRPDIRSAERQLAAQSAQIGVAVTDLYPAFSIGGSIGSSDISLQTTNPKKR